MAVKPRKGVKHGPELVQRTRKAILNALDVVENRGKLISEMLADEFEKNPIKFMELASKFTPKDLNVETTVHRAASEMTAEELNGEIDRLEAAIAGMQEGAESDNTSAQQVH